MEPTLRLISVPFLGGLIGWLTNRVAIAMLFRPRNPVRIMGISFQGVIPRRRAEIANRLAEAVERDLVNSRDVADMLGEMDWGEEIENLVERVVEEDLRKYTLGRLPLVGTLTDNILFHFRSFLAREINSRLGRHREAILERIHSRLDLKGMIIDKVNGFDLLTLETMVKQLVRREFRTIEILGGVLGFLIGSIHLLLELLA